MLQDGVRSALGPMDDQFTKHTDKKIKKKSKIKIETYLNTRVESKMQVHLTTSSRQ